MFMHTCSQVMEKAEVLRDADANLLPALLRLRELVRKCSELSCEAPCCCRSARMKRREESRFDNLLDNLEGRAQISFRRHFGGKAGRRSRLFN